MSRRTLARYRAFGPVGRFVRDTEPGGGGGGTGQPDGAGGASGGGDGSQSAGGNTGGGGQPPAGGTGTGTGTGTGGQGGGESPRFTQADLDRIIGERVAAEKARHQQELQQAQDLAGKSETEKLQAQLEQANSRVASETQKAAERVARSEIKGAARDLDARPDRLDAILRQVDPTKVMKDGEVDDALVRAAVEDVLKSFPEWKRTAGSSASGGEMNGGGSGKPTFTRKQIEDMSDEERERRIGEINEALADGRVTG